MMPSAPILVFDGTCTLCNRSIQWVYSKDQSERILFTSLQSQWAHDNIPSHLRNVNSVLFFDGIEWYTKSDAVLQLLHSLPRPWQSFYQLNILPVALRNAAYDLVARFRYTFFGKGYCALLPKDRILD